MLGGLRGASSVRSVCQESVAQDEKRTRESVHPPPGDDVCVEGWEWVPLRE